MTDRKRPPSIAPGRTLVRPGAVRAAAGDAAPPARALVGPGEIGKPRRTRAPDAEPAADRLAAQAFGLSAESKAAAVLLAKGYRVLARRWRSGHGEVDIVARGRDTLLFVEVKARGRLDDAAESVVPRQRRRIVAAAEAWLAAHPEHAGLSARFDVILVAPGRLPRHIPAAFDADG